VEICSSLITGGMMVKGLSASVDIRTPIKGNHMTFMFHFLALV